MLKERMALILLKFYQYHSYQTVRAIGKEKILKAAVEKRYVRYRETEMGMNRFSLVIL